jgi:pimeloyl-ACP methyl ester carboxylesterase
MADPIRTLPGRLSAALLLALGLAALPGAASADPVRTATVELGKATLFYREAGKGHPAVFVHALLTDSRTWNDQLLGLADRSRMFAPDLSGQGFSSQWYADKISSEAYADELLEFIDALQLRAPVDVVGLSGGGMIAALACAKRPAACRSLVLISTVFDERATDPAGVRYRAENARTVVIEGKDTLFRRFNEYIVAPGASLKARARYRTMLEQTPYEQFVAFLTTGTEAPRGDLPARLKLPVMIPVGQGDGVLTPAMAEKTAALFPDARVVVLPSAGRLLPIEAPREFNDALRRFWDELDSKGDKR